MTTSDAARWADIYADQVGIDPSLIVPRAKVERIRRAIARPFTKGTPMKLTWLERWLIKMAFARLFARSNMNLSYESDGRIAARIAHAFFDELNQVCSGCGNNSEGGSASQ
jgi:hypothetical protein